jgi:hypothetical protein
LRIKAKTLLRCRRRDYHPVANLDRGEAVGPAIGGCLFFAVGEPGKRDVGVGCGCYVDRGVHIMVVIRLQAVLLGAMNMASLFITRGGGWIAGFRDYRIILDGTEVARIGRDSSVRVPASVGPHTLYAKISWCRSKQLSFELADHEERRFEVGSNITPARMLVPYFSIVYKDDYLSLREVYPVCYSPFRADSAGAV